MTFTTYPAAGEKVRASKIQALIGDLRPISAFVTADQALATSSTTLQNITDLSIAVAANLTYEIDVHLMAVLSSGTTEDIKVAATFPAGATLYNLVAMGGSTTTVTTFNATDMTIVANSPITSGTAYTSFGLSTTVTGSVNPLYLQMSSTAGTFQVQAAQNTSGANTVTVKKGSLLVARRLS